jgi:hypothetical protein
VDWEGAWKTREEKRERIAWKREGIYGRDTGERTRRGQKWYVKNRQREREREKDEKGD